MGAVLLVVVAHLADPWAYRHLVETTVYQHDLGRLLRVVGFYPLWVILGLALWLQSGMARPALLLGAVPGITGLTGEALKILLRRERPGLHDGAYVFRAFGDHWWATTSIGLPSSHATTAFGGAWILYRLWPKAWPVWFGLAGGCVLTRVLARGHFLSDVTVGAVVGVMVAEGCWRWHQRRAHGDPACRPDASPGRSPRS